MSEHWNEEPLDKSHAMTSGGSSVEKIHAHKSMWHQLIKLEADVFQQSSPCHHHENLHGNWA